MNTTVWKYPLKLVVEQTIDVPLGADALCLQLQDRTPCLWVAVNPDEKKTLRTIKLVGTGMPELDTTTHYLGTVQLDGYVWHYFEVGGL
ncbi:MAG TPA: hypothetical protein VGF24_37160 [Vicinamibacterales bacterium]|jgi:hypothetical protein